VRPAPVPGHLEIGRPHASRGAPGLAFGVDVAMRVLPIGDGVAISHHCRVEVLRPLVADRKRASVPVRSPALASYRLPADPISEVEGGEPAAGDLGSALHASLARLRRVYAVKADAYPMDLEGISVDHAGGAAMAGKSSGMRTSIPSTYQKLCRADRTAGFLCR
jgi:hypothetical protein